MSLIRNFLKIWVICLTFQIDLSTQLSKPEDPTYSAAVVEFVPESEGTTKEKVKSNLKRIKNLIESEETRDLDIIVFPESAVNSINWPTYLPDPQAKISPCDRSDYDWFLSELSCAVRSRALYAVFNVVEKVDCMRNATATKCNAEGIMFYNTNVVFDRQGRLISRYRKTNLYRYEWYSYAVQTPPDISIFPTDFGVTFGHFICFDMLFYEPAMNLINDYNITDIVYPTYWFSELPFLTAIQLQEGWAFANDVNLLAAGISIPSGQNTGSGIFAGKLGRLSAIIYEEPTTIMLKAIVPKRNRRDDYEMPAVIVPEFTPALDAKRLTKLSLIRDYNVDIFTTKLLYEQFTSVNDTLCHNQFCCSFNVKRTLITSSIAHSAYRYRIVAYEGPNTTFQRISPSDLGICALIACTTADLYSCGHTFPSNVLVGNKYFFNSISVRGKFRKTKRRSIQPSTVDGEIMPLPTYMYTWTENTSGNYTEVSIDMTSPKSDLLTFGIWTNYFSMAKAAHNLKLITTNSTNNAASNAIAFNFTILLLIVYGFNRLLL